MTKKGGAAAPTWRKGCGGVKGEGQHSQQLSVSPRDSTMIDEAWVRDLSGAGPTHHSALGTIRKDCWVTERQGLLLLIILCIWEAGTVVQLAPGKVV